MTRWFAAASLAALVTASGCGWILGLDEFVDAEPPTAAGGGGGGAGGGPVCEPEATETCYGGPAGTEDVGICKAGTRTCAGDGSGYSECSGEVLPGVEDCYVRGDEDCDGNPCSDALWSRLYGGPDQQTPTGLAVDAQGNLVLAGIFRQTITFGDTTLVSSGQNDFFVVKIDKDGTLLWAKKFGNVEDNGNHVAAAVDAMGNIAVVGDFAGTINFGGADLTAVGQADAFVVKLDSSGGHVWSKRFGSGGSAALARDVAFDSQGNLVVTGAFAGSVNFGGSTLTSGGGSTDIYLARFSADAGGAHQWSKKIGEAAGQPASIQEVISLAIDPSDNLLVAGYFTTSIGFGGVWEETSASGLPSFVAKLDASGAPSWSKKLPNCATFAIAADSMGAAVIGGRFNGPVTFDGSGAPVNPQGALDAFITKYSSTGAFLWVSDLGGTSGSAEGYDVTTDQDNNVILTGYASGTVDLGAGLQTASSGADLFVSKRRADGMHVWSKLFEGNGPQWPYKIESIPNSNEIIVTGIVNGSIDFGDGSAHASAADGFDDVVVAKLAP